MFVFSHTQPPIVGAAGVEGGWRSSPCHPTPSGPDPPRPPLPHQPRTHPPSFLAHTLPFAPPFFPTRCRGCGGGRSGGWQQRPSPSPPSRASHSQRLAPPGGRGRPPPPVPTAAATRAAPSWPPPPFPTPGATVSAAGPDTLAPTCLLVYPIVQGATDAAAGGGLPVGRPPGAPPLPTWGGGEPPPGASRPAPSVCAPMGSWR